MSLSEFQVLTRIERLSVTRLRTWIDTGCVRPGADPAGGRYTEADVARLRLLCELADDLAIGEEALPVVVSLIDQLHGLRRQLRCMAEAVERQPSAVREDIARHLRALADG